VRTAIRYYFLICLFFISVPAFADQSTGYQYYFNEGVKAFKEHDDREALRCFKIAQIYDPNDDELKRYLSVLDQQGVVVELPSSQLSPQQGVGYRYYLKAGIKAFWEHDKEKAVRYLTIAIIFDPSSQEADRYLRILATPAVVQPYQPSAQPQPSSTVTPKSTVYVAAPKPKQAPTMISLSQIFNSPQAKPTLRIELNSSVILEGRNIQRFLVVDEGFIGVKAVDTDHLEIDALRIGTTFLHIWDDLGRRTLYVEIVFPKTVSAEELQANNEVQHSQPFRVTYSNDWSTYYTGKNIPALKRESYDFEESLGVTGETPYGFFDASGSYIDFNAFTQFDTYTVGLSQIPVTGTSNFNLRGFDALRYLSPLTMPGTRMRGVFADVDLMEDNLGLSVSHGQVQVPLGFLTLGGTQFNRSYIDAVKLTLFPKSDTDQYAFNFATSYGADRPRYLSDHVYSVEGHHKFNDHLTLNAEEGSDSSHDATLASLKWEQGNFRSGLHFRNIDKNYAAVSTLPSYQGETGADWTTEGDFKNFTESTFVEAYRDHLEFNPDHPSALNYDANGHLKANITSNLWSDSDLNFIDTPGELSPRRSLSLNERLSRSFGIWNGLKGTVFGGTGYQNSHSSQSDISDYDRENVIAGIQLPLTDRISVFSNYEYDWLHQPKDQNGDSNPSVINAGVEYQKQFNPKFSINAQAVYRDELGVRPNSSFLSGEQSVIITSGFAYNPTPGVSIFADANASKVMSHTGNLPYDDFEVHVGMRITFGGATYWDPLGTVSGIVFKDKNGDGKFISGDEGIPDVKVKVGDKIVTTDKYGRYRIQIRAKGVEVTPVLDTVPGGLIFSTPQLLNVQVIQGRQSKADFGLTSQTGIYGIVFVDKNGSGTPNSGDQFIGKVKVILDGKTIQKSDSHGAFYFRKVSPGEHIISVDINSLTLNMVPLVKLRNKIDVAEGTNYMFNVPVQIKQQEGEN